MKTATQWMLRAAASDDQAKRTSPDRCRECGRPDFLTLGMLVECIDDAYELGRQDLEAEAYRNGQELVTARVYAIWKSLDTAPAPDPRIDLEYVLGPDGRG